MPLMSQSAYSIAIIVEVPRRTASFMKLFNDSVSNGSFATTAELRYPLILDLIASADSPY